MALKTKLLREGWVTRQASYYFTLMLIITPLLNFLPGTASDLIAPSMPTMSLQFDVPASYVQNLISVNILGFAIACLFTGVALDKWGRRPVIMLGLLLFFLASVAGAFCSSIEQLFVVRFIQGFAATTASIGSRALVSDHFSGHAFLVAILYTSVAYSSGMIISPFLGSVLQTHFGWRACFLGYAILSGLILSLFILAVQEQHKPQRTMTFTQAFRAYLPLLKNIPFLRGSIMIAVLVFEQMIFPTLGPFIVEHQLHYTTMVYGSNSLILGACYLSGGLTNRALLKRFTPQALQAFGLGLVSFAALLYFIFSAFSELSLFVVVAPLALMSLGIGFVFSNTTALTLKPFAHQAGLATAAFTFLVMFLSSIGVYLLSVLQIQSLLGLGLCLLVAVIVQWQVRIKGCEE